MRIRREKKYQSAWFTFSNQQTTSKWQMLPACSSSSSLHRSGEMMHQAMRSQMLPDDFFPRKSIYSTLIYVCNSQFYFSLALVIWLNVEFHPNKLGPCECKKKKQQEWARFFLQIVGWFSIWIWVNNGRRVQHYTNCEYNHSMCVVCSQLQLAMANTYSMLLSF